VVNQDLVTAPDLLARIARRYRGQDLPPSEAHRMVAQVMAAEFGVHPNSIYLWAKRFGWKRPAWYLARRPKREPWGVGAKVRGRLLAAIERAAAAGVPCPSNAELARALGTSLRTITLQLVRLRRDGEIASQSNGPLRRLTLSDGRATGWTRLTRHRTPSLFHLALEEGERRSRPDLDARLAALLADLLAHERPLPGNPELGQALGCVASTVRRVIGRAVAAGKFRLELAGNDRRVIFADGAATPWPAQLAGPVWDPVVRDALRALQRQGVRVWDLAVHTGRAWGVAWSLDGRTVNRAELLAEDKARRLKALAELGASP
jgi:hypothetical protein